VSVHRGLNGGSRGGGGGRGGVKWSLGSVVKGEVNRIDFIKKLCHDEYASFSM
jgi:hypothetical protein